MFLDFCQKPHCGDWGVVVVVVVVVGGGGSGGSGGGLQILWSEMERPPPTPSNETRNIRFAWTLAICAWGWAPGHWPVGSCIVYQIPMTVISKGTSRKRSVLWKREVCKINKYNSYSNIDVSDVKTDVNPINCSCHQIAIIRGGRQKTIINTVELIVIVANKL